MATNCRRLVNALALAVLILGVAQANATVKKAEKITNVKTYSSGYVQGGFKVIPATQPNTKYCALSQKVLNGNLTPYSDCTVYQQNGDFFLRAVSNVHAGILCSMTCFSVEEK